MSLEDVSPAEDPIVTRFMADADALTEMMLDTFLAGEDPDDGLAEVLADREDLPWAVYCLGRRLGIAATMIVCRQRGLIPDGLEPLEPEGPST